MKKKLLTALLLVLIPILFQCSDVLEWFISDEEEVALGTDFYEQLIADTENYPLLDTVGNATNKMIVDYVDSIGRYIATHQTARPENEYLRYHFTVIDNDTTVNAFAVPGGYIFMYTGLLKAAGNEAEIAGVMAHEIGHITQRHGVDAMGISYVKQLIFGDDPGLIVEAVSALAFLKFSRENEYEADSCAVEFLISGGYNPSGMKTFLELLAQNSGWGFEPLSTHPDTDKRVQAVKDLIAAKPAYVNGLPVPDKKIPIEKFRK